MRVIRSIGIRRIAAAIAALLLAGSDARADALGEVWAVEGTATAGQRSLARGDAIASDEAVTTAEDSRLGIISGELYVQLEPSTTVRLERGPDERIIVALEAGRARVVDTREDAGPAALRAGGGVANLEGADVEFYVLSEKAGRYAMFCTYDQPIVVARDARQLAVDPGACALVKPGEPPYLARGHAHQVPLAGIDGPQGVYHVATGDFLPPVAAGPLLAAFGGPVDPPALERDPCDEPGSGCALAEGGPPVIIEPPPDTGGCTAPGCGGPLIIEPAPDTGTCGVPGCE